MTRTTQIIIITVHRKGDNDCNGNDRDSREKTISKEEKKRHTVWVIYTERGGEGKE